MENEPDGQTELQSSVLREKGVLKTRGKQPGVEISS